MQYKTITQAICALAFGLSAAAQVQAAPVIVTPTDLQGWALFDGSSGTSPTTITGTQAYQGNGSLQLSINAGNQQPAAAFLFSAPVTVGSLLGSNMSFGYSYLTPAGSSVATSPTIRLLLSGLTNSTQSGRSDGSLGFYADGADGTWDTDSFDMNTGDFFLRVGGKGQETTNCTTGSYGGSFDDRRQTLASWASTCSGTGTNTVDLDDATVIGIEVDFGSIPGFTGTMSVFADGINFNIGGNTGDYNFETANDNVPEPASIALVGLALAGVGLARRRRSSRNAR